MPLYLEISRLHRTASITGRGRIDRSEIMKLIAELMDARIQGFAKLVDVSATTSTLTPDQIERMAVLLAGDPAIPHGPVAFLVDPDREGFAHIYERATAGRRAVRLFTSLAAARQWLLENAVPPESAAAPDATSVSEAMRDVLGVDGQGR